MMKKFITSLFAAVFAVSLTTAAYADNLTAVLKNGTLTISSENGNDIILAGYDDNGVLCGARYIKADNTTVAEIENAVTYRVCETEMSEFSVLTVIEEPSETPNASDTPNASEKPSSSPAPTPEGTSNIISASNGKPTYPSVYEKEKDAVYTIAIVDNIASVTSDNYEDAYSVDVYIRGEKESFIIPSDIYITVASDYYADLSGKNASALKKGDIVYFEKSISGKFKAMSFIYRPLKENIITSETDFGKNFEKLFAHNNSVFAGAEKGSVIPYGSSANGRYQYAFGVVARKYSSSFTLYNKGGNGKDAIEIEIQPDTIVYVCDISGKNYISLGKAGSITKSSIPNSAFDDDDNIAVFSDDYEYNYALARVVNGTATEVVLYTNYNN